MSAGAGARAVSQACEARPLSHLQAFFKSLFSSVISRIKMQCAEDAEATRLIFSGISLLPPNDGQHSSSKGRLLVRAN